MTSDKKLRTMDDIPLNGRTVLVRVDFNMSVGPDGKIGPDEDYRITAALPTIQELTSKRCKVILLTHLGQTGEKDGSFDLDPIKHRLEDLLQEEVRSIRSLTGSEVSSVVAGMEPASVALLPNVRTDSRELSPNIKFGQELASNAEAFINEAFSASHRNHTSLAVLPTLLPACAGRRTVIEYDTMASLMSNPERPYVAIVGGAKVETKIRLLSNLLATVDYLCVGGRLANAFLVSLEYYPLAQCKNVCDSADMAIAGELLAEGQKKIILPVDVVISRAGEITTVKIQEIPPDTTGVWDVGPETVTSFLGYCQNAGTIMWNGPMGKCEEEPYRHGTESLAQGIAKSSAYTVVGGGDTLNILAKLRLLDRFSHVSIGGGAMIYMLQGNDMPGLKPLYR